MSYIDVLNDAAARADAASTKAEGASQLLEDIANGPVETYVPTLNGQVPTAATAIDELRTVIMGGATAPIIEAVTLTSTGQTNITFNNIQTSGLAVYIDEGSGAYRYFNFTVDGTTSIVLGDSFQAGTIVWGTSQEIGGDVETAVQQTQANAQLAEDWAILTGQTVDGTEYSAKHYSEESASSASAAATSEQNAAQSESNAATSEQNAALSEQNASLSETNAVASESAAAISETNAASSASEASSSASAAATSESNAASSASAAEASATTATNMADSVAVATETYSSTAEGIASTDDGDYFRVASLGAKRVEVWKNATGVAEFIEEYYTSAGVDEQDSKVVKLNRSLQRNGDNGQTYHADFAYDAYGLGTRMSGGVDKAVSFEDMSVEVERATPKWVMQPSGPNGEMRLTEVPVDTLAREFDPVTGGALGLLVESEATNVMLHSDDPSQWEPSSLVELSTQTSSKIPVYVRAVATESRANSMFNIHTSDPTRYISGLFRSVEGGFRYAALGNTTTTTRATIFDLHEGVVTNVGSGNDGPNGMIDVGDGWYLCWSWFSEGGTSGSSFRATNSATSQSSAFEAGQGIEFAMPFKMDVPAYEPGMTQWLTPPSYIPTTDSPVTRAADNAVIDLSDVLNPDEGTYVVRAVVKDVGERVYYGGSYSSGASQRMEIRRSVDGVFQFRFGGASDISFTPPEGLLAGDVITLALSYNNGAMTGSVFGEVGTSSTSYVPPGYFNLVRGAGQSNTSYQLSLESSGTIAGFEYYPRALTEAELIEVTS